MLTLEQIVDALTPAARAEFSDLFYQAQIGTPADQRREVAAVAPGADAKQALIDALALASAEQWLDDIIELMISKGIASGAIVADYANRTPDARLHAMLDAARGYRYPDQLTQGMTEAKRYTAKVLYDGVAQGTGVLIGPDLILTAWHPLREAFDRTVSAGRLKGVPRPDAAASISFAFDDILIFRGRGRPKNAGAMIVKAAPNWHVCSSPCHSLELLNQLPADKLELENHWDYVVVRLEKAPGLERRWVDFDARSVVPPEQDQIYILQHPGGNNMKFDDDKVGGPRDFSPAGDRADIRFIHYVNSDGGSSGAPCFDKSFSFFGIHQGAWPNPPARAEKANRGVPITTIIKDIVANGGLPSPDPTTTARWNLNEAELVPAIGREDFQSMVWDSALKKDPQIIVIRGDGDGKSFLLDLVNAMLPDKKHAKVLIEAEIVAKAEAPEFVEKICNAAGAQVPVIPAPQDSETSRVTWRTSTARKLVEALNEAHRPAGAADSRTTWLLFRDMNRTPFEHEARELLLSLCIAAKSAPGLRIVLDGFGGDVPQDAAPAKSFSPALLTAAEVDTFFRRLNAEYDLNIDAAIAGVAQVVAQSGGANATNQRIVEEVNKYVLVWIKK